MSEVLLKIHLPPHSKKRPKVTANGVFYDKLYQQWMRDAILELQTQWTSPPLTSVKKLIIQFFGNHAGRDLDNMVGAVTDSMTKAEIITSDNLNVINHLEAKWERSKTEEIHIIILL